MSYYENKNVVVTGGAGFMGSHLSRKLVELGANVTVLDNLEKGTLDNIDDIWPRIRFTKCDLTNRRTCEDLVRGDLVFHLAFKVGGIVYTGNHNFFSEIWHDGSLMNINVIEACRKNRVEKLLFMSSACVYGGNIQDTPDAPPIKESMVWEGYPMDAYGWAKLMGELQFRWYYTNHGLRGSVIRPFNIYGEQEYVDLRLGHALPVLCRKAIEYPKYPFEVHGDGFQTRSFLYVSDMVNALLRAMERIETPYLPLNIGTTERVSIRELVTNIIRISGKSIEPTYLPNYKVTGVRGRVPDISEAKKLLDWSPTVSLDEGLLKTYRWVESYLATRR